MLTQADLRGFCGMLITPALPGADNAQFEGNNVNLVEGARAVEACIQAGVGSLALCGTTGEGHSLTWEEKVSFIDTAVQTNKNRIPLFAGATTLGTRATVNHMKALRDLGAPGAFVGLALWQTPTIENASQWYKDIGDAVPDMGVMVYANSNFFKTDFPLEFWQAVVAKKAATVITCKMSSGHMSANLEAILRACGKSLFFMPGGGAVATYETFQKTGTPWQGFWSTAVNAGPEPLVALADALEKGDLDRAREVAAEMATAPGHQPQGRREEFRVDERPGRAHKGPVLRLHGPGPVAPALHRRPNGLARVRHGRRQGMGADAQEVHEDCGVARHRTLAGSKRRSAHNPGASSFQQYDVRGFL